MTRPTIRRSHDETIHGHRNFFPGLQTKGLRAVSCEEPDAAARLAYLNSWLKQDGDRCFQLMETNDPALFEVWFENWKDLGKIELVELGEKPQGKNEA